MRNPPSVCQQCEKLKALSLYMSGECEYMCGCPNCEYREAFKQAEKEERSKRKGVSK